MRKVVLTIVLLVLLFGCYEVVFNEASVVRKYVASVSQLEMASRKLDTQLAQLEKSSDSDYAQKKKELTQIIENYRTTKQEYEQVVSELSDQTADALIKMQENDLKDIYDVDFLWTIIGNYATEEGINLKFDVNRNVSSASSLNNTSTNYVICDLQFVITGKYINLADFIRDIEDDDRLNFEINDFDMQKSGSDLQVTLTVREIKINSDNLIESNALQDITNDVTQTIDSITSGNTTNTTTNTTTTNTTNTTSSIQQVN